MDEHRFLARFATAPQAVPHPGPHQAPTEAPTLAAFTAALEKGGGRCLDPVPRADLARRLQSTIDMRGPRRCIVAPDCQELLPDALPASDIDPASWTDEDLIVWRSGLGVCENGAVLLTDAVFPQRADCWLAGTVIVLLDPIELAWDLHAAAARLPQPPPSYACWIAGPSKTADIEQTLVVGAQGPIDWWVLPVSDDDQPD